MRWLLLHKEAQTLSDQIKAIIFTDTLIGTQNHPPYEKVPQHHEGSLRTAAEQPGQLHQAPHRAERLLRPDPVPVTRILSGSHPDLQPPHASDLQSGDPARQTQGPAIRGEGLAKSERRQLRPAPLPVRGQEK